ncbi:MAG: flagellar basal body L-ring protein FlgH [Proteobacteria bacterium]|nr:flagellar basal body L-ring protein FlgH [Pseudomonadota bacterium]
MKPRIILSLTAILLLQSCTTYSPYNQPKQSKPETYENHITQDIIKDYIKSAEAQKPNAPGSLWQSGSNGFFKDNRAKTVGDIITVLVSVSISAETSANTESSQTNTSQTGVTTLLNLADNITHQGLGLGSGGLLDTDADRSFSGSGKTDRTDTLDTTIAATVTQVLPNGHMLIQGKREVTINYEMQELNIAGIIRPEDVSANNTISSNQIAQARVSYGGKGNINEVQTKKWGIKFIDRWMPF